MVGTSGWQYKDWRGSVYPEGIPQRRWLERYAERFATVEVNNAFYRLPARATFEAWAATVPERFSFAVKVSRYLTHIRRLREPVEPVHRLCERAAGLGSKLGPLLLQLPPTLQAGTVALDATLASFPPGFRVVVEVRHPSWVTDEAREVMVRHNAACCAADRRGPLAPQWRTASWGYARFHEGQARPDTCYGRQALRSAVGRLCELYPPDDDLYVYFNNDHLGCAVRNAESAARLLAAEGWRVALP